MKQDLGTVFAELGISQYLDSFVEQGFDTWETILDITESDLDALGVKLGHRRKLQRRIANSRGHAPYVSLVSSARASIEDAKADNPKSEPVRPDTKDVTVVTKRKYRRHPKPDENAPERPPSAYVLFSNKMRDDLKGRNLTFTEIAKLVGENWQSLSPAEKEPFETQALTAKEKYNQQLGEYKKTPEYRKYMQYLHDFKQKQASQNQAKDASKRLKLESGARLHHGSSSATPVSGSGTGSGSDSHNGSDSALPRKHRMGSATSMPDAPFHAPAPVSQPHIMEDLVHSPASTQFDRDVEMSPILHASPRSRGRRPVWADSQLNPDGNPQQPLPSLSDMFSDSRGMTSSSRTSGESNGYAGFMPSKPPPLKHEPSPAGSMGSSSSGFSYPRTPSDASLPIHALLSGKGSAPPQGYEHQQQQQAAFYQQPAVVSDPKLPFPNGVPSPGPGAFRGMNGHRSPPALLKYSSTDSSGATEGSMGSAPSSRTSVSVHESANGAVPPSNAGKGESSLDGMNALLRAGEIVGRRES